MNENEVLSQWLDPDEVRSLAEGLLAKTPVSQIPSHESVFGESFEGFDGEPELSDAIPAPVVPAAQAIDAKAKLAPIAVEPVSPLSHPTPEPKISQPAVKEVKSPIQSDPFRKEKISVAPTAPAKKAILLKGVTSQVPKGSSGLPTLPRALEIFADWLKKQTPILAVFICDPKGKVVVDEIGSEKLIKVARSLSLASISKGKAGSRGLLQIEITNDRIMEILPLKSSEGHSITGLVVARPLTSEASATIRRSFETALSRSLASGE